MLRMIVACGFVSGGNLFAEEIRISPGAKSPNGVVTHTVRSPYQAGETKVRVLLPTKRPAAGKLRTLYVLPVEAGDGKRWGDPIREVIKTNLHNDFGLVCVFPTFSHLPWYADHPTDRTIRQESYLLRVVLPFVEKNYPAMAKSDARFLVGFSKSGWGAFSLLLRNPNTFAKAAAWDAPLMKAKPNQFGMGPIFGNQQRFEQYEVTRLLKKQAKSFKKSSRLVLSGIGNFEKHHTQCHALMKQLGIRHVYRAGPKRKHHWSSGWLKDAVRDMVKSADSENSPKPF